MPYHILTTEEILKLEAALSTDQDWLKVSPEISQKALNELWANCADDLIDTQLEKLKPKPAPKKRNRRKKEPNTLTTA